MDFERRIINEQLNSLPRAIELVKQARSRWKYAYFCKLDFPQGTMPDDMLRQNHHFWRKMARWGTPDHIEHITVHSLERDNAHVHSLVFTNKYFLPKELGKKWRKIRKKDHIARKLSFQFYDDSLLEENMVYMLDHHIADVFFSKVIHPESAKCDCRFSQKKKKRHCSFELENERLF